MKYCHVGLRSNRIKNVEGIFQKIIIKVLIEVEKELHKHLFRFKKSPFFKKGCGFRLNYHGDLIVSQFIPAQPSRSMVVYFFMIFNHISLQIYEIQKSWICIKINCLQAEMSFYKSSFNKFARFTTFAFLQPYFLFHKIKEDKFYLIFAIELYANTEFFLYFPKNYYLLQKRNLRIFKFLLFNDRFSSLNYNFIDNDKLHLWLVDNNKWVIICFSCSKIKRKDFCLLCYPRFSTLQFFNICELYLLL